ncbi:MAG: DUF5678 domain-containing protein [Candidatus Omnitrophota bacterium]
MIKTLIKNSKYNGNYVAFKDFSSHKVIAYGKTPQDVQQKAEDKGYKSPVIVFAPLKNRVHIY